MMSNFDLQQVGSSSKHLAARDTQLDNLTYPPLGPVEQLTLNGPVEELNQIHPAETPTQSDNFGDYRYNDVGGNNDHVFGKVSSSKGINSGLQLEAEGEKNNAFFGEIWAGIEEIKAGFGQARGSSEEAGGGGSFDSFPTNTFRRPQMVEHSHQNKLTQGLAMITNLCFEGFDNLEQAPQVLIKLRDVLMETIYYCIEVNRQVYEEFVFSILQKSKLYMAKLIHRALKMCRNDSRSTTCYHVIKCVHDITLLTFTFTNPYKFSRLLEPESASALEGDRLLSEEASLRDSQISSAPASFCLVLLLETNRSLINSMTEIKQSLANPQSTEVVNDTPRDLFRFEFKEILSLLERINLILLNNCIPDESIFAYYLGLINSQTYVIHDLDSLEEYLCHFSRLHAYVKQMGVSPAADPFYSQIGNSLRKRKAKYQQKQRRENAYNRMHSLGPLFYRDKTSANSDEKENARFHLYQRLRQKGIEIHPNGTHNIHVTTEFLQQVDVKKRQMSEQTALSERSKKEEHNEAETILAKKVNEEADPDEKLQFMLYQKRLIQSSFQDLICNFPKLKWCTPLQSINYLQIFVDLYNEIYHEDLVIEQKYDESGNLEDTVIKRMDDEFKVKRGHYNFREQTSKDIKIPEFVNFFSRKLPEEDAVESPFERFVSQQSEVVPTHSSPGFSSSAHECKENATEHRAAAGGEFEAKYSACSDRATNHGPSELRVNPSRHDEVAARFKAYQREYESRYSEAYEILCESEHINRTEQWSAYFAHLKAGFDSDRLHITNCKLDQATGNRKLFTGSETGEVVSQETAPVLTSTSDDNGRSNSEFPQGGRIPLSLKVFQLNEAVAYEVRNIRADYEDAHVVKKVDFKEAKCYKCKYFPWHKH